MKKVMYQKITHENEFFLYLKMHGKGRQFCGCLYSTELIIFTILICNSYKSTRKKIPSQLQLQIPKCG